MAKKLFYILGSYSISLKNDLTSKKYVFFQHFKWLNMRFFCSLLLKLLDLVLKCFFNGQISPLAKSRKLAQLKGPVTFHSCKYSNHVHVIFPTREKYPKSLFARERDLHT